MKVTKLTSGPYDVNVYVVHDGDEALIVDASSGLDWPTFGPKVTAALGSARTKCNYLTHWHVDHVGGVAKMAQVTGGAPALIHTDEAIAIEQGDATLTLAAFIGHTQDAHPTQHVKEGDTLQLGNTRFEILLTPGHSPAHTTLWDPETRSLFSGDVVFEGGSFGRVDFPGCDPAALLKSLEKLANLDPVAFYPGHMRPVTVNARAAIQRSLDNARLMI